MKAVILDKSCLSITDVPKPSPGIEQALVKISTSGVCHSDAHLVKGDWPNLIPSVPIRMGHEGIGVVEALGPGADRFVQVGDRVILGLGGSGGGYWCGACEYCLNGRPRLCSQARPITGTYAEYIALWAKSLVKLPDSVGDEEVSLACGGLTAYGACKKLIKFGITPGHPIAIVGAAGGLGHYAIQIAKAFGYKVVGIDVGPEKAAFIKKVGADYALDVNEAAQFIKKAFKGVHASIIFAPKLAGFELGLKILRRGGLFIGVGMPAKNEGEFSIHPLELLRKDPLIMSSAVGTVQDMRELVQLAAEGKVKSHVSRVGKLSEIGQILEELAQAKYSGRAIINNMSE